MEQATPDQIAFQQNLVLDALGYARVLARKFYQKRRECGFSQEEFESAAFLGLCDSARRYDPRANVSFRGFAYMRIQGEMQDLLRSNGNTTRKQLRALGSLVGVPSLKPNIGRLLSNLHIDLYRFKDIIEESGIRLYFNDRKQVIDLSYAGETDPEEQILNRILCSHLRELMLLLPERERLVIHLKYFEDMTFEEMGRFFDGATRSWLCRIHGRGLAQLRELLLESCNKKEAA